jgi:hypothetical protein
MQTQDEPDRAAPAAGGTQAVSPLVARYLPMVHAVIAKHQRDSEHGVQDVDPIAWLHLIPITGPSAANCDRRAPRMA